ncbi:MAG: peroxin [Bogoriella megaspora]|nr:MAG: peroxin [Bogoriella megaspora]
MFQGTRRWFRRNRTNFAIGAGILGAGYLAGQYVLGKISEARQRMSDERIAKENLRRRFEQNQEDCTLTVLALLPTLKENIIEALPVERTVDELKQKSAERVSKSAGASDIAPSDLQSGPSIPPSVTDEDGSASLQSSSFVHASQMAQSATSPSASIPQKPRKSKVQLWNEMKIDCRLSLLSLLTRIQLNLLGRRNYLSSVITLASPPQQGPRISLENRDDDNFEPAYGNDFETNRQYLAFSWWLLHRGSKDILEVVKEVVQAVFGPLSPKEELTMERLSQLTLEVRKRIEGATEEDRRSKRWLTFLLPPSSSQSIVLHESGIIAPISPPPYSDTSTPSPPEVTISPSLRRLLNETSDLADSPTFSHVLTLLLDSSFSLLIDSKIASQAYKQPPLSNTLYSSQRVTELSDHDPSSSTPSHPAAKLAIILSVFCKQAHAISAGDGSDVDDIGALNPIQAPATPGNEYLAAMETVRDLEAFAAVVYSSNFEFEAADAEAGATSSQEPESKRVSSLWDVDSKRVSTLWGEEAVGGGGGGGGGGRTGLGEGAFENVWRKALEKGEVG